MATPRTTFIVATDREGMILEKLAGLEEAVAGLVPLLEQIVTHLEAQTPPQTVGVATYADLYGVPDAGPPEGELVAAVRATPTGPRWRWWRRPDRRTP